MICEGATHHQSKKESIPKLMMLLIEIPIQDLRAEISDLVEAEDSKESNSGFSELTEYLIKTER